MDSTVLETRDLDGLGVQEQMPFVFLAKGHSPHCVFGLHALQIPWLGPVHVWISATSVSELGPFVRKSSRQLGPCLESDPNILKHTKLLVGSGI